MASQFIFCSDLPHFMEEVGAGSTVRAFFLSERQSSKRGGIGYLKESINLQAPIGSQVFWLHVPFTFNVMSGPDGITFLTTQGKTVHDSLDTLMDMVKAHLTAAGYHVSKGNIGFPKSLAMMSGTLSDVFTWQDGEWRKS